MSYGRRLSGRCRTSVKWTYVKDAYESLTERNYWLADWDHDSLIKKLDRMTIKELEKLIDDR